MADNNEENQVNDDEIDAQIQSVNAEIAKIQGQIKDSVTTGKAFVQTTYRDGHWMVHYGEEHPDTVKNWYSERATNELVKGGVILGGIVGVVGTAIVCSVFGKHRH